MGLKFANNVSTTLASGINAGDVSITVADASRFPTLAPGDFCYISIVPTGAGNYPEICRVTSISGNVLSVERGQDGTSATSHLSAERVEMRITRGILDLLLETQVAQTEKQIASAAQTVFNLATITYTPGVGNLYVFVNGVKQVLTDDYTETDLNTVTFASGLADGDVVEFVTNMSTTSSVEVAQSVSIQDVGGYYTSTNVESALQEAALATTTKYITDVTRSVSAKLGDSVSIKDFGAECDGVTDDTTAIQTALTSGAKVVDFTGVTSTHNTVTVPTGVSCININSQKLAGGGALFKVNSDVSLQGKIVGTGIVSRTATISNGAPAVVTYTGNDDFPVNTVVYFISTGTLPTGLSDQVPYYVINLNTTTHTFNLSSTVGGTAIATSSAGSGTHTLYIDEHGVFAAANDVTNVYLDLDISNINRAVQAQPLSGTAYADAPKRWSGKLRLSNIVGASGSSEGYGLLLSPAHHFQFDIVAKTVKRHAVYLSAGASYNNIKAMIDGCENYAAQIFSTSPQPNCEHNVLDLHCANLSESVAGQGGPLAIVGQAHYNTSRIHCNSNSSVTYGYRVEGGSGGPYPFGNRLIDSTLTGAYLGLDVVSLLNADSTIIKGNVLHAYGTAAGAVVASRRQGTNGSTHGGHIEGNIINAQGQTRKGVYIETNTQPSYVGPNEILNNGTGARVDDQSGGYRMGYSRKVFFKGEAASGTATASISATSVGDTTVTLPIAISTTQRKSQVYLTNSSSSMTTPNVVIRHTGGVTETEFKFRVYNGAGTGQSFDYHGWVEGD